MRLSVDDLALLTYCLGVAPSPGMGLWTGTKSLPPQMLLSHQILCQFLSDVSRSSEPQSTAVE